MKRRRVLISAYACEPGRGSEPGVGWNVALGLGEHHDITVITRANHRDVIRGSTDERAGAIRWIYIDLPPWQRFWKKWPGGVAMYYFLWQRRMLSVARDLEKTGNYDVCHHLTFGNYLPAPQLARLDLPLVIGPVGGGECAPECLKESGGLKAGLAGAIKGVLARLPSTKKCYAAAACSIAATHLTRDRLEQIGARNVQVLPQSGCGDDEVSHFAQQVDRSEHSVGKSDVIRLVSACRLVRWKGMHLALEALSVAVERGLDVRLDIIQTGPELERLKAQCERLAIADRVRFLGRLGRLEDVYEHISRADALVHPAVSEAFGQSCLEALVLGTPVICLDWAGPGMIVDETCGWKVAVADDQARRRDVVDGLAQAFRLVGERSADAVEQMSCAARQRAEKFRWSRLVDELTRLIDDAVEK